MSKKPPLDPDDIALWKVATKGVEVLPDRENTAGSLPPVPEGGSRVSVPPRIERNRPSKTPKPPKGHELDARNDARLRRGQMPIEATLDLHGLSQLDAHEALKKFILESHAAGKRCVLVITGKGRLTKPAVLRRRVPEWLFEGVLNGLVLKTYPAQPKHGGSGALYVYLRRDRSI